MTTARPARGLVTAVGCSAVPHIHVILRQSPQRLALGDLA